MLELMRNQLVRVEQAENKGPIQLTALTDVPAEQAVQDAILSRQMAEEVSTAAETVEENKIQASQAVADSGQDENELSDDPLAAEINAIEIGDIAESQIKRPRIPIQEIPAETRGSKEIDESRMTIDGGNESAIGTD
jgi:hypothetical protein